MSFLIYEDRIGRPVLKHMKVDINPLLEERAALLDGPIAVSKETLGKKEVAMWVD